MIKRAIRAVVLWALGPDHVDTTKLESALAKERQQIGQSLVDWKRRFS